MPAPRQVRAVDVAKAAGVSTATVSYVLNNNTNQKISPATQERVRTAARELGYVSNVAAQTLARGKSTFMIVDMSAFATEESAALASEPILSLLRSLGYTAYMTWWPTEGGPQYHEDQLVRFAQATRAVGVISLFPLPPDLQLRLQAVGVSISASFLRDFSDFIGALKLPVRTQVEYLAHQGHTEILYVASDTEVLTELVAAREQMGQQECDSRGLTWVPLPRHENAAELVEILRQARIDHPNATAIAAYNDVDALAALGALSSEGVAIPQEMAVIGIDNEPFTRIAYPAITTVAFTWNLEGFDPQTLRESLATNGPLSDGEGFAKITRPRVVVRDSA